MRALSMLLRGAGSGVKAGSCKATGTLQYQTLFLQRKRSNNRALEENLQDLAREHEHLREQHQELSLDYVARARTAVESRRNDGQVMDLQAVNLALDVATLLLVLFLAAVIIFAAGERRKP